MGLFGFTKKEDECDRCGNIFDKKLIGKFDTTHQGKRKDGEVKKLCKKCMIESIINQLKEFKEKAIIIKTNEKYNAYVFYHFDELETSLKRAWNRGWEEALIKDMKSQLPSEQTKCSCCGEAAQFTYCSLDIFKNRDPYSWEVNLDNEAGCKFLCKECLINTLKQNLDDIDKIFSGVYPMVKGSGFLTPWDI